MDALSGMNAILYPSILKKTGLSKKAVLDENVRGLSLVRFQKTAQLKVGDLQPFKVSANFADRKPGKKTAIFLRKEGDPLSVKNVLNSRSQVTFEKAQHEINGLQRQIDHLKENPPKNKARKSRFNEYVHDLETELARKTYGLVRQTAPPEKVPLKTLLEGLKALRPSWLGSIWLAMKCVYGENLYSKVEGIGRIKDQNKIIIKYKEQETKSGYDCGFGMDAICEELEKELLRLISQPQDSDLNSLDYETEFDAIAGKLKDHLKNWNKTREMTLEEFMDINESNLFRKKFKKLIQKDENRALRREVREGLWKLGETRVVSHKYLLPLELKSIFSMIDFLFKSQELAELARGNEDSFFLFEPPFFLKVLLKNRYESLNDFLQKCLETRALKELLLQRYIANTTH